MAELTFTLKIPALDRLCDLLEAHRELPIMPVAVTPAIVQEAPEAAPEAPAGKFEPTAITPAGELLPASEAGKAAPEPTPEPTPVAPVPSMDAIQRAAAELRDQGKLKAVTAMFPEFHIRKLSDLQPDQLGEFAERLRGMGAKL
jgi:hypothetical protein